MRRPYSSMTELTPSRVNFGEEDVGWNLRKISLRRSSSSREENVSPGNTRPRKKTHVNLRRSCIIIHQVRGGSNGLAAAPATRRPHTVIPASSEQYGVWPKARGA